MTQDHSFDLSDRCKIKKKKPKVRVSFGDILKNIMKILVTLECIFRETCTEQCR